VVARLSARNLNTMTPGLAHDGTTLSRRSPQPISQRLTPNLTDPGYLDTLDPTICGRACSDYSPMSQIANAVVAGWTVFAGVAVVSVFKVSTDHWIGRRRVLG